MKKLQVNLEHLAANLQTVRSLLSTNCAVCATIKADAYGHGLIPAAQRLADEGVDFLGITTIQEARALRRAGITAPILLYLPANQNLEEILSLNLIPFVSSLSYLEQLEGVARITGETLKVHIKVDVGMGRYGCLPQDLMPLVNHTIASPHLTFDGFCAHFSESEELMNPTTTREQLARFETLHLELKATDKLPPWVHIANSEGLINFPESHYNLVRPGIMLYGAASSPLAPQLHPVLSLCAEVTFVKWVPTDTPVSYNSLYRTQKAVQLCAVPLGYSDGLDIHLAQQGGRVYLNGNSYPIVGRVCMNTFLVEVPLDKAVQAGDVVELVGKNQNLLQWASYYPSGSAYDAVCRLGCYQSKTYK